MNPTKLNNMRRLNMLQETIVVFRCILLLLLMSITSASAMNSDRDTHRRDTNLFYSERVIPQPRAVNIQTCYYHLLQAAFYDDTLSQSDFITFIQLSSGDTLGHVNQWGINITGFNMLNPEFVGIYNLYACGDAYIGCPSIEGIDISGDKLQATDGSEGLLNSICNDVYGVIDMLNSKAPTQSPIGVGGGSLSSSPTVGGLSPSPTANSTTGVVVTSPTTSPSVAVAPSPSTSPSVSGFTNNVPSGLTIGGFVSTPTTSPQSSIGISSSPTASPTSGGMNISSPTISPSGGALSSGPMITGTSPSVPPFASPTTSPTITAASSPSVAPAAPTSTACPPAYVPNTLYQAFDQVSNPNDFSSGKNVYVCKWAPDTTWCSMSAYEPGVSEPWSEAWGLVGECDDDPDSTGSVPPTENGTSLEVSPSISPISSLVSSHPSYVPSSIPSASPSISSFPSVTSSPTTSTKSPSMTPVASPTKSPAVGVNGTTGNPDDPVFTGSLLVDFSYEVGNIVSLKAQSIESGENPTNNMMEVLLNSTTALVEHVVAETFRRRILNTNGGHTHGLRSGLLEARSLEVTYPGTVAIDRLEDISCPSSQPEVVVCQRVSCRVELSLTNEPKLSTELKFKGNLYQAIDDGAMNFPDDSGIIYSQSPLLISVNHSEIINGRAAGGVVDDSKSSSWVLPVIIVGVVFGLALVALLISFHVIRGKHKSEVERALNLSGEDLLDEINGPRVMMQDRGSLLFDEEQGNAHGPFQSKKNLYLSSRFHSESDDSSPEDLDERKQKVIDTSKLDQLKAFAASADSASSKSIYRAGVEALLRETAPDEIENLDELLDEYDGREEELIGMLSSLLANMNRSSQIELDEEDDEYQTLVSSVSSANSARDGYDEVKGQIEGGLKSTSAAAAAATLFTGVSTKEGLGASWSSSDDDSDDSGDSDSDSSEESSIAPLDTSFETGGVNQSEHARVSESSMSFTREMSTKSQDGYNHVKGQIERSFSPPKASSPAADKREKSAAAAAATLFTGMSQETGLADSWSSSDDSDSSADSSVSPLDASFETGGGNQSERARVSEFSMSITRQMSTKSHDGYNEVNGQIERSLSPPKASSPEADKRTEKSAAAAAATLFTGVSQEIELGDNWSSSDDSDSSEGSSKFSTDKKLTTGDSSDSLAGKIHGVNAGSLSSDESNQHSKSMYRAGVEALLREAYPGDIEKLDELMAEYEGQEEELIGQLSATLATTTTLAAAATTANEGIHVTKEEPNQSMQDTHGNSFKNSSLERNMSDGYTLGKDQSQEELGKANEKPRAAATAVALDNSWSSSDDPDSMSSSNSNRVSSKLSSKRRASPNQPSGIYTQVKDGIQEEVEAKIPTPKTEQTNEKTAASAAAMALDNSWSSSDDSNSMSSSNSTSSSNFNGGSSELSPKRRFSSNNISDQMKGEVELKSQIRKTEQTEKKSAAAAAAMALGDSWSSSDDSDSTSKSENSSEGSSEIVSGLVNLTPSTIAKVQVGSTTAKQVEYVDDGSISSDEVDYLSKFNKSTVRDAPTKATLSETSVSSGMSGSTLSQSLDRTQHFAKLVENGDWEGVVQAAADLGAFSRLSPSQGDSTEIRAEIEALIKDVVPDELDNIDEMMTQFQGREQDLIQTLRAMQYQRIDITSESQSFMHVSTGGKMSASVSSYSVFENDSIRSSSMIESKNDSDSDNDYNSDSNDSRDSSSYSSFSSEQPDTQIVDLALYDL